jgi:hypothetical protein
MDSTYPMTPEAKRLNLGRDYLPDRMSQLDEHDERRRLTLYLPAGRVLDQQQLDLITSGAQTWAPLIVRRQLLAEAGARAVGQGMILRPEELEQLRAYADLMDKKHTGRGPDPRAELVNPVSSYGDRRRG